MQIICNLHETDNHKSTSPLSFLQAGHPSCRLNNTIKAHEWKYGTWTPFSADISTTMSPTLLQYTNDKVLAVQQTSVGRCETEVSIYEK